MQKKYSSSFTKNFNWAILFQTVVSFFSFAPLFIIVSYICNILFALLLIIRFCPWILIETWLYLSLIPLYININKLELKIWIFQIALFIEHFQIWPKKVTVLYSPTNKKNTIISTMLIKQIKLIICCFNKCCCKSIHKWIFDPNMCSFSFKFYKN